MAVLADHLVILSGQRFVIQGSKNFVKIRRSLNYDTFYCNSQPFNHFFTLNVWLKYHYSGEHCWLYCAILKRLFWKQIMFFFAKNLSGSSSIFWNFLLHLSHMILLWISGWGIIVMGILTGQLYGTLTNFSQKWFTIFFWKKRIEVLFFFILSTFNQVICWGVQSIIFAVHTIFHRLSFWKFDMTFSKKNKKKRVPLIKSILHYFLYKNGATVFVWRFTCFFWADLLEVRFLS